ncbi:MAG: ATP-dependent sacrificial sulfur transferase LarE [Candidatus Sumerlaeia bacterium]|nr:ATP-dependent sacrificial sulfur transferase LarE [Candidatus Sumerlaeia bacterium]
MSTTELSTIKEKAAQLESTIAGYERVLVAFSGGVDSTVVLKAAANALGVHAHGILARTESNTDEDVELCRRIAREHQLPLEIIEYSELEIENYAANPINRCFFCKNELYQRLTKLAEERGIPVVMDGSNVDDGGDYRPGLQAVAKHGVVSPLRLTGCTKSDVRALAQFYGLPNHDRPASPCLSSRIPYGSPVTRAKLEQVAKMEGFLRTLGLVEFRCRHHEQVARLELHPTDFPKALENREKIVDFARSIGFFWVALDLAGFKSGSLNSVHLA